MNSSRVTYLCSSGSCTKHVRIQPPVGLIESVGVMRRNARCPNRQQSLVFALPRVFGHQEALELMILALRHTLLQQSSPLALLDNFN